MQDNFYIATPEDFTDSVIVFKNGKFKKARFKCGEANKQTIDARLAQEAANAGDMEKLFAFCADTNKIDAKRQSGFDKIIFGHNNIANTLKSTIWKNLQLQLVPEPVGRIDGYGDEYMDFAKVLNEWLTKAGKDVYGGALEAIKTAEPHSKAWRIGVLKLIIGLLSENMPALVEQYTNTKIVKKKLELYNHQILGLRHIVDMLNRGMRNIIAQLPCRFGKTLMFLDLFKHSHCKLMIVVSYMKTVGASYIKEAQAYEDFEDIQIVDIDDCDDFKYAGGKILAMFPMTGDEKTNMRRAKTLQKLNRQIKASADDIFLLNEEADFGNHTDKADAKFSEIVKLLGGKNDVGDAKMSVISTTGTEAGKAAKLSAFGDFDGRIACNPNDWHQFFV